MLLDPLADPCIFVWSKIPPATSLPSLTDVWGPHVSFSFNLTSTALLPHRASSSPMPPPSACSPTGRAPPPPPPALPGPRAGSPLLLPRLALCAPAGLLGSARAPARGEAPRLDSGEDEAEVTSGKMAPAPRGRPSAREPLRTAPRPLLLRPSTLPPSMDPGRGGGGGPRGASRLCSARLGEGGAGASTAAVHSGEPEQRRRVSARLWRRGGHGEAEVRRAEAMAGRRPATAAMARRRPAAAAMARPTAAARARRRRAGSRAAEARAGVAEAGAEDSSELLRRGFAVRDGLPAPAAEEGRGGGIRPGAVNPDGGGGSFPSPPLSRARGSNAVEVRLKEKLTCGPHTSVREGREVAGVFWTIRKYTGLRVGPRTSKTYKMARFKEEKNCNGTIQNT